MNNTNNSISTNEGELILDSHKLAYHYDRVEAWESGESIPPVSVDMALTRACGAMCSFCYAMVQEPQERIAIKTKDALELLDDFAEIGVRGVSLISDGESTLSKAYAPFIKHADEVGIDVGNATNGWEWGPEKIEEVLPHLSWVRFTVAAGNPESYSKIMFKGPEHTHVFDRAMEHIKYAVELKKRKNLKVTLGIQMVLMPEFKNEILPFAKLAVDLGVDYGVIKHCSDDEFGTLGVDYDKYLEMYPLLQQAEEYSNDKTKIIIKWDKIKDKGKPSYKRFYGPQFLLQISGSGLVAPSGMFFNARYSKFHMGNFAEERFINIFRSDRYKKIMDYLASSNFDAQTMMGTLPIQHYVSVALDNHVKGIEKIIPATNKKPLHVNFL
ncbi:MAG TPA: radical SAM protein [Gammaproteobacteria bacterium]|jgi:MoaA/NifB/PqqE/SkfB family radical SAM enzyme|nr:radical SAM protein [Gammaproteobacteria bacterium]|tara:strand:- start:431 stop:1579 length:1149 start_codon:yes stop_codon:yes gene_type:complete